MIYKSGTLGTYEAYDYVKAMIGKMGNIKEFKAFCNDTDPYFEIEDGYKQYYHLILIDDRKNEFWIDTNCGYSGTGPSFTEQILQLIGARENYNVEKNKIIHEKNLELNNNLNVLVVLNDFYNTKEEYKILFMVEAKFNNAALRFKTFSALETLGEVYSNSVNDRNFNKYFGGYNYIDNSSGQYKVNNILFINKHLKNISINHLREILNTMFVSICGDFAEINFTIINEQIIEE